MKIAFAFTLFTGIPNLTFATIRISKFGGCLNTTVPAANEKQVKFHCHFDSSSCADDETWLNSFDTEDQGYGPCTCDDDYNSNVYTTSCYDMKNTHAVECAVNAEQCPPDWYVIGTRFNSDQKVEEECGHGDAAFTDDNSSCGKRCTCNFQYQSRDTEVTIGSTTYGMCYDESTGASYCAAHKDTCGSSETFYNPHSAALSTTDCTCENVHVGGCMDGSTFSHCGVTADSCKQGQDYLAPRALRAANGAFDCRLCHDSWSENSSALASSDEGEMQAASSDDNPPAAKSDDDKSSDDKSSDDKSSDDKSSDDKSSDDVEAMEASDDDDSSSPRTSVSTFVIKVSTVLLAALFLYK